MLEGRLSRVYKGPGRLPWVQPLILLSNEGVENRLSFGGKVATVTREGFADAITHGSFPGAPHQVRGRRIDQPTMRYVVRAFEQAGLLPHEGKLQVGSFELGAVLTDAPSYQDREATHELHPNVIQRARIYLVPQQTSVENRKRLRRAAEREYLLLHSVREHAAVLSPQSYTENAALGPTPSTPRSRTESRGFQPSPTPEPRVRCRHRQRW